MGELKDPCHSVEKGERCERDEGRIREEREWGERERGEDVR